MPKPIHMEIKPAKPPDTDAVRCLVRDAYAQWIPVIGCEPMPMRADYAKAIQEHGVDLLFAGAPDHRGHRLGRHLRNHTEQQARHRHLATLRLLNNQAFETNVRLHQSGLRIDRTEPFAGGGTTVYMSKPVTANTSSTLD